MFGFSMKTYLYGAAILMAVTLLGGVYWHYSSLEEENGRLTRNNTTLKLTIDQNNETIKTAANTLQKWKDQQREVELATQQLAELSIQARHDQERLQQIFLKHNIGKIAQSRPGLVEKRVNAATKDAMQNLSCASDSKCKNTTINTGVK